MNKCAAIWETLTNDSAPMLCYLETILDDPFACTGLLPINVQIHGAFSTCSHPHARESQPVAKAHALWISEVCNKLCSLVFFLIKLKPTSKITTSPLQLFLLAWRFLFIIFQERSLVVFGSLL